MANPGAPQFRHRHTVGQHISQPDDPTKRAQVATRVTSDDFGLVVRLAIPRFRTACPTRNGTL